MNADAKPSKDCSGAQELLAQRLDAELSTSQSTQLQRHLESCADCRHVAEILARVDNLALAAANEEPKAAHFRQLSARILDTIEAEQHAPRHALPSPRRWPRWPRWTLPVLVPSTALALLLVIILRQEPAATPTLLSDARQQESQPAAEPAPEPSAEAMDENPLSGKNSRAVGRNEPAKRSVEPSPQPSEEPEAMASRLKEADSGVAGLSSPPPAASSQDEQFAQPSQPGALGFAEPTPSPAMLAQSPPQPRVELRRALTSPTGEPDDRLLRLMLAALPAEQKKDERLQIAADADAPARAKWRLAKEAVSRSDELTPTLADSVRSFLRTWLLQHPEHALADSVRAAVD